MQAIITKYLGPPNYRGSRVKATAERGSVTVDYDDSFNGISNHRRAASALIAKFVADDVKRYGAPADKNPWNHPSVTGWLPGNGGAAHVFVEGGAQ